MQERCPRRVIAPRHAPERERSILRRRATHREGAGRRIRAPRRGDAGSMSSRHDSRDNAAMDEMVVDSALRVRELKSLGAAQVERLAGVLIECVEGGASVGFILPMTPDKARTFWTRVGDTLERGARRLLVAETAAGEIVGTVQLVEPSSENQPHRADV